MATLDFIIETCMVIIKVIVLTIYGAVKALLPPDMLKRKSVAGEIVLITGSGSGLGRLLALEFGKLGARLVLWDVNKEANDETKKMLQDNSIEAHEYTVDIAKREQIYAAADKVKAEVGNVDILINNAGIVSGKKLFDCTDEQIELTMAINTNAHFFTAKAFIPHMLDANHGHVVTIASMAGKIGTAGLVDYSASKYAAIGIADSLRSEIIAMKKDGVHVTTICPFYIDTGMFEGVQTKFPSLLPIMEPEYVVKQIMEAVLTNMDVMYLPRFCYFGMFLASFLPSDATHVIYDYFGINSCMDHFTGRKKVPAE